MAEAIYWATLTDLTQMLTDLLASRNLDEQTLVSDDSEAPTLADLVSADETLMLLEQVPLTWLEDEARKDGLRLEPCETTTDFNGWQRGRIFNPAFELRWERTDGAFQIVYCGQQIDLPDFHLADGIDLTNLVANSYFLWGAKVQEDDLALIGQPAGSQVFVELQVPRLLRYPVSAQARQVKLQVAEYRDAAGVLVYYRFQGLEEIV